MPDLLISKSGIHWWRRRDSNPRPLGCEPNALPAELRPHFTNIQLFALLSGDECSALNYTSNGDSALSRKRYYNTDLGFVKGNFIERLVFCACKGIRFVCCSSRPFYICSTAEVRQSNVLHLFSPSNASASSQPGDARKAFQNNVLQAAAPSISRLI